MTSVKISLFIVLIVFILFISGTIPFIIFELSTQTPPSFSISNIAHGSLVNITEKQLITGQFQLCSKTPYTISLKKHHVVKIDSISVPVRIEFEFNSIHPDYPVFREPIKILISYESNWDSLFRPYVHQLVQRIRMENIMTANHPKSDSADAVNYIQPDTTDLNYIIGGNTYFFEFVFQADQNYYFLSTTIFSGKLFLMLKYYVCRYYLAIPDSFCAKWFIELTRMSEH